MASSSVRCPCCRFMTLTGRGLDEICQVCLWHDDGQDDPHAEEVWGGPNGNLSLMEARRNFRAMGAVERRFLAHVRKPREDEM